MTDWGDLGPKDQAKVQKLFQLIDFDKDGIINYREVRAANGGDPDGTMQKMFQKLDKNKDGQCSEAEWDRFWVSLYKARGAKKWNRFLKALASAAMSNNPPPPPAVTGQTAELSAEVIGLASAMFGMLDLDANGTVSREEFANAHGDVGGMWSVLDNNSDDELTLRELLTVLGQMQESKGQDLVIYYIKSTMLVVRENQADNPKARPVSLAGRCTHEFHQRSERVKGLEDKVAGSHGAALEALSQKDGGEYLVKNPDVITEFGPELLVIACWKGDSSAVPELIISGVDINSSDSEGFSALMYAILGDNVECMKALYKADSSNQLNWTAQDATGATAMMVAACEGNMSAGGALMAWCGSSTQELCSLCNNDGTNPLMLAAQNGHETFVAFLLSPQYGINSSAKNGAGKTAEDLAQEAGHVQVAVMINEAIAAK